MEWSSKMPAWDLADLEQSAELNLGSLVGPSFVLGSHSGGLMDCSVDLKLGGLGDFRQPEGWGNRPPAEAMAVAVTAVPSKRTRAVGNGGLGASCLVDGCKSDLSNSREYHRRHKVCEVHSKTPVVMVGGQEQRFCQQCSRFHQLVEFDEVKRSCRKRLDGHNRRRRKPPPESINPGGVFPNIPGSRFLMYPYLTPAPTQGHTWSGVIKPEDALRRAQLPQQRAARGINQFPFLQDDNSPFDRPQATLQPFLETISAKSSSCSRILAERSPTQVFNSDCALSLLSSAQDVGVGVGQMLPAGRIPIHQSLVSGLPFANAAQASGYVSAAAGFSCSTAEDEQVGNAFICGAEAGLHYQGVFNVMGGESSDEASRALPFSWQ